MELKKLLENFFGIFSVKNMLPSLFLFWLYNLAAYALLIKGVSRVFAYNATIVSSAVLVGLLIATFLFRKLVARLPHTVGDNTMDLSLVVLSLIPLTPIARYILLNQDVLTLWESLLFFIVNLLISGLFILVIPFILKKRINPSVSIVIGVSLVVFYFSMPALSHTNNWYNNGSFKVQVLIFATIFVVISLLYSSRKDFLYPVIVVFFVLNIVQISISQEKVNFSASSTGARPFALEENLKARSLSTSPDIYLLTYDSYIQNELMVNYGIENSKQENFLIDNGFTVYYQTYSKGRDSLDSMSQMLNMTDVSEIEQARFVTSGNGSVFSILKSHGYRTYAVISSHFYGNLKSSFDVARPTVKTSNPNLQFLFRAVVEGQFRFNIQTPEKDAMTYAKRDIIQENSDMPKVLYNHTGPSHSQNSGKCLPDEIDRYRHRLQQANREMKDDIKAIQSTQRDAIIIINGDHGPYLLGDCLGMDQFPEQEITRNHLQDRYGAFIAIRWPKGMDGSKHDGIKTIQDVFPAIFSTLFKDEDIWNNRPKPVTDIFKGSYIDNGIIKGGADDGERLYHK